MAVSHASRARISGFVLGALVAGTLLHLSQRLSCSDGGGGGGGASTASRASLRPPRSAVANVSDGAGGGSGAAGAAVAPLPTGLSLASGAYPLHNPSPGGFSLLEDRGAVAGTCRDSGWDYVLSYSPDDRSGEWDAAAAKSHRTPGASAALCGYGFQDFFDGPVGPANVMLDIGANMGLTLLPFYTRGWKIIAFEPVPENANTIRRNIYLNGAREHDIALIHGAVTNTSGGFISIYAPKGRTDNTAVSRAASTKNVGSEVDAFNVTAVQIDEYLDAAVSPNLRKRIALVKIDTQGHELSVLQGMKRFLSDPPSPKDLGGRTLVVEAEYAPNLQRASGHDPNDMLAFMRDLGYEVRCQLNDENPIVPPQQPNCPDVFFSKGKPVKPTSS